MEGAHASRPDRGGVRSPDVRARRRAGGGAVGRGSRRHAARRGRRDLSRSAGLGGDAAADRQDRVRPLRGQLPDTPGRAGCRALGPRALVELRDVLRTDPRACRASVGVGMVMARRGRTPEAISAYRSALQIDPKNGPAYLELAQALSGSATSPKPGPRRASAEPRRKRASLSLGSCCRPDRDGAAGRSDLLEPADSLPRRGERGSSDPGIREEGSGDSRVWCYGSPPDRRSSIGSRSMR